MLNGAVVMLAVNIAVGALFGLSYIVVALTNANQRRALWLGVSYLVGNLAPLAELVAAFAGHAVFFDWVSYFCFLIGLASMSLAFSFFYREPMPVRSFAAVITGGVVSRCLIDSWPHASLRYGFGYQAPFAMACALSAMVVLRHVKKSSIYALLVTIFALTALHFLTKPFLLVRYGSASEAGYTHSLYALLSQALTGILLFGCGIVLLIVVSQKAITDSQTDSETDVLSGVLNRRGFDREAAALLDEARKCGSDLCAVIFDIDFFKSINDTHGHAMGDRVIVEFASVLRETLPRHALIGRIGGEEFAALLTELKEPTALRFAEDVRVGFAARLKPELDASVSGGVAAFAADDQLSHMLRRADQALYWAKNNGRNRMVAASAVQAASSGPGRLQSAAEQIQGG